MCEVLGGGALIHSNAVSVPLHQDVNTPTLTILSNFQYRNTPLTFKAGHLLITSAVNHSQRNVCFLGLNSWVIEGGNQVQTGFLTPAPTLTGGPVCS